MTPSVEMVVPVLNEERALPGAIGRLHGFMTQRLADRDWSIMIADNGSDDTTPRVCRSLTEQYEHVRHLRLEQRGRGRALLEAWLDSTADILAYTDVDLSTDLEAFPELLRLLESGGCDVAIGSRLKKGARVHGRSVLREVTSRGYSLTTWVLFRPSFQDAQCGLKAISRGAANALLPLVVDTGWFFDTELLLLAERSGYTVGEVPVTWTDDPDSRVDILKTAYHDVRGLLRLRFGGLRSASAGLGTQERPRVGD